ncbi:MAG: YpjP family protein [Bacillus sp. (in: firmicutes)]
MKTPKWMKKSLLILLSIITLGLVTPDDFDWQQEASAEKSSKKSEETKPAADLSIQSDVYYGNEKDDLLKAFILKAEEASIQKFGEKIKPRIEDEFQDMILPKIEEALETYIQGCPDEEVGNLEISEKPAYGTKEKIFHIYNRETGEDMIRFHVRRENPPKQGHWFNFHYHTKDDQFQNHYPLGTIFWSKNTPPNWGSKNRTTLH